MMDASECRKVALKAIKEARKFFGIDPAWDVALQVGATEEGKPANIGIELAYRKATICLDPAQCDTAREVWRYMGHEVAHIVHSEFDLFRDLVQAHAEWPQTLQTAYRYAEERATVMLEQLFMRERPCVLPHGKGTRQQPHALDDAATAGSQRGG
jgi:hypothetical protein